MDWLNYHHLFYFWVIAREGSVVRASAQLCLAQSTISGQIHSLGKALQEQLFMQVGRHLQLTDVGQVVYRYADGTPVQTCHRHTGSGHSSRGNTASRCA